MKIVKTCPLGSKCERMIDEDTLERCVWFEEMEGTHPNTGEKLKERKCVFNWILLTNMQGAQETRQAGAAVESLRNHVATGNQVMIEASQNGCLPRQ